MIRLVKLYPSKQHFQRSDEREVPLAWAEAYLGDLIKAIPASERESARISWPPTVQYVHRMSPEELLAERMAYAQAVIAGMSQEERDSILGKKLLAVFATPKDSA